MNADNTGKKYAPIGAMFITVSSKTGNSWKLGDIKPEEGSLSATAEYIQEFDSSSGAIGTMYCYVDAKSAAGMPFRRWSAEDQAKAVGWWVRPANGSFSTTGPTTEKADAVEFAAGQGLYSNFGNLKAKLGFSGEVVCEERQLDLTGKKFSPIINYLARPITLKEIVPEEGSLSATAEYIQEFNPTSGAIGTMYCYVDAKAAAGMPFRRWSAEDQAKAVGWWVRPANGSFSTTGPTTDKADTIEIRPGEGFYSNFGNLKAKLNFPSSIPAAE